MYLQCFPRAGIFQFISVFTSALVCGIDSNPWAYLAKPSYLRPSSLLMSSSDISKLTSKFCRIYSG